MLDAALDCSERAGGDHTEEQLILCWVPASSCVSKLLALNYSINSSHRPTPPDFACGRLSHCGVTQTPITYLGPSREPERLIGPECRIERKYGTEVRVLPRPAHYCLAAF